MPQGVTNRALLEPRNRGLMEPVESVDFRVSDGVVFSVISVVSQTLKRVFSALPPRQIWCNFDDLNLDLPFGFSSAKSFETGVLFAVLNFSSVFFESDLGSYLAIRRETPDEMLA